MRKKGKKKKKKKEFHPTPTPPNQSAASVCPSPITQVLLTHSSSIRLRNASIRGSAVLDHSERAAASLGFRSLHGHRPRCPPMVAAVPTAAVPASRKRSRSQGAEQDCDGSADRPAKHVRLGHAPQGAVFRHALLARYYSDIQTLRQYVLSSLPASSRVRRRKIASVGAAGRASERPLTEDELALGELLDSTVVARRCHAEDRQDHRWEQWVAFSQKGDESSATLSDGLKGSIYSQSEVSRLKKKKKKKKVKTGCSLCVDSATYTAVRKLLDCRLRRLAPLLPRKCRDLAEALALRWLSKAGQRQHAPRCRSHTGGHPGLVLGLSQPARARLEGAAVASAAEAAGKGGRTYHD